MISGFNTDVELDGVVYHVQTEDKGPKSPLIVSLVYDRGTILASKRAPYDGSEADSKTLADKLQRQHQLICAAVRAGRMNELKGMASKAREVAKQPEISSVPAVAEPIVNVPMPEVATRVPAAIAEIPVTVVNAVSTITELQQLPETVVSVSEVETIPVYEIFDETPMVEGVSVVEDEAILPAEAVAVVSEPRNTLKPGNSQLNVELIGEVQFKGGDRRTVNITVCRGTERKMIGNADIMVKVLGSSFRPLIFHARSDLNGLAKVHMQLPHFQTGRAALLIRAIHNGDETELRRVLKPG